jgi:hypothetical protein
VKWLKAVPAPAWYVLGALVAGAYALKLARAGAAALGGAVNPTSDKNVFYSGANAVTRAVTGDDEATLGTKLADFFYGDKDNAAIKSDPGSSQRPRTLQ